MQLRTPFYHALAGLLLSITLSACAPLPTQPETPPDPDIARATELFERGQYLPASALYEALAARTEGVQGTELLLQAIHAAILGDDLDRAGRLAQQAQGAPMQGPQPILLELLTAESHLARRQGDRALQRLLRLAEAQIPGALQTRYLRDLADAYRQVGNLLESAHALQRLDRALGDDLEARLEVQARILRALTALSDRTLQTLQPVPPDARSGWMELARLVKAHGADPTRLAPRVAAWRERFPNHPLLPELLRRSTARLQAQVRKIDHIAVLLPRQGRYAAAAQALRDGIMATYYRTPEGQRPILRFYDSSDPANAWPLYTRAVANGAQAIIGPLQKPAVSQLLRAGELDVPVLALNRVVGDTAPPANFHMFSLDPEHEAALVAERIWQQGRRQPITLVPDTPWGQRLKQAFDERWQALTGMPAEGRTYPADSSDYSEAIRGLLHLDLSEARHRRMQRWLGQGLEFEPRRRHDVDAVFVAARPREAQSMHPQLAFFRAGELPMYTTSHAWSGALSERQLPDMRGIRLPDIPLLAVPADRARLGETLPGVLGPGVRLYAMGMDALSLMSQLSRLRASPYETLDGQTGNLYLGPDRRVVRQLVWLELDSPARILGYADRMDLDATTGSMQRDTPADGDQDALSATGDPGRATRN